MPTSYILHPYIPKSLHCYTPAPLCLHPYISTFLHPLRIPASLQAYPYKPVRSIRPFPWAGPSIPVRFIKDEGCEPAECIYEGSGVAVKASD